MNGYAPVNALPLAAVGGIAVGALAAGLALSRLRPAPWVRAASWLAAGGVVSMTHIVMAGEPAGLRMLALCWTLLYAMKAVVSVASVAGSEERLSVARWLLWATCWPGMRPAVFARRGARGAAGRTALRYVTWGLVCVLAGAALILAARMVWVRAQSRLLATLLLMPGLSLCVHFGLFGLLAGLWQALGVDARPLFRNPPASSTLGEFWGKRWNLAFSEMVAVSLYRPLSRKLGAGAAVFAGFLLSGVLHEIAISLPVNAGFGLPMAYFALHGALVLVERTLPRLTHPPWRGRLWAALCLLAPAPILFHLPFLRGVIWPIIGIQ